MDGSHRYNNNQRKNSGGFPGGSMVKNLPANKGDTGSFPVLGRAYMPGDNKACGPQLLSPEPHTEV